LQLDKLAEMKAMLISINPSLEEQAERQMHHIYDIFANLSKLENEAATAGMLKKGKMKTQVDKVASELQDYFMRTVRDFADLFRKEQRDIIAMAPRLQAIKPEETKAISTLSFPNIAAGNPEDFQKLHGFAEAFSKRAVTLHQDLAGETKTLLDENKRTVETYQRHVTIDTGEVATTVSTDDISRLPVMSLILLMEKLRAERTYLDGRKDEVTRMLSVHLVSDIDSLSASAETASKLGLELPVDFGQKLRVLGRDSAKATNLTTLMSLDNQLQSARTQLANLLRDRIINIKHEVTTKIVDGGIPTTADIIPQAPLAGIEREDIASLLSSLGKMAEWTAQVRLALKDRIEDILQEIGKALEAPTDSGIKDTAAVKQFLADSRAQLGKADVDALTRVYLKARTMQDDERRFITEKIRSYLGRFNELATSADRVLDYAQLSKKAPKVDELQSGGIAYLLQSLGQLKQSVDSGVATFRDACNQEIEAIIEDLQTIKPAYAEIFMPITERLDEGKQKLQRINEFAEIRSEMRNIKDTILVMAKEALENLRYRLGVKIRLAAAKLMGAGVEIPPEVQEGIAELNNTGVAAETVFSLPAIARKMIEIYEQKISSKVIELLMAEVTKLETSFGKARIIGVDLGKELQVLASIRSEPPEDLEAAADSFDRLQKLTTSPIVLQKIKSRASEAYVQIRNAVAAFEQQGMADSVGRLKTLIDEVPTQLAAQPKHVFESLDVCLTLANIQEEMITMIKTMSSKDRQEYEKTLRERSKYYSTIERVYEKHPKDFSALIYPLDKMKKLESDLASARMLDEALKLFNQVKELRKGWVEKAEKMDEWHKTLKMYMTGFSPGASSDQRQKFVDEAIKKIKDTYSREDISSYLSWAVKEIVASMMEKRA
jgi:hypothetical protein